MIDLEEIKSRINPAYQEVRGTESYERRQLCDEIDRLTACLKKANSQTEHFEREWYLRGDEIERLQAAADALQRDADRYKQLVQMTDRGCYQLMYWNTDRDDGCKVRRSDDGLYPAMKG